MKINICDVCFADKEKLVKSKYQTGYKNGVKVSVCEEHENWGKGKIGREAFEKMANKLLFGY